MNERTNEEEINDIFQREIARELLLEKDPELPDTTLDYIWSISKGNPWNCPVLYDIMKIAGKL